VHIGAAVTRGRNKGVEQRSKTTANSFYNQSPQETKEKSKQKHLRHWVRNPVELHRKGISPIIATVILVLIAVAAGVMLWLWVSGFTSAMPAEQQALNERIRIDAVKVEDRSGGNKDVTIYVRNIGKTDVAIGAAYILDTSNTIIASNTTIRSKSIPPISPGSVEEVEVEVSSVQLRSGYAYVAKVVTINGVETTYTFVAP
jgi:flagellin-like protein